MADDRTPPGRLKQVDAGWPEGVMVRSPEECADAFVTRILTGQPDPDLDFQGDIRNAKIPQYLFSAHVAQAPDRFDQIADAIQRPEITEAELVERTTVELTPFIKPNVLGLVLTRAVSYHGNTDQTRALLSAVATHPGIHLDDTYVTINALPTSRRIYDDSEGFRVRRKDQNALLGVIADAHMSMRDRRVTSTDDSFNRLVDRHLERRAIELMTEVMMIAREDFEHSYMPDPELLDVVRRIKPLITTPEAKLRYRYELIRILKLEEMQALLPAYLAAMEDLG